jgi:hypothetical protein
MLCPCNAAIFGQVLNGTPLKPILQLNYSSETGFCQVYSNAIAWPIPMPEPVTSAILPASEIIEASLPYQLEQLLLEYTNSKDLDKFSIVSNEVPMS